WLATGRIFDDNGKIIESSDTESYQDLFMVRRLWLFQAYDRESEVAHQLRLEVYGKSKDKAPEVIIKFLKQIQVLLQDLVIIAKIDNKTEFTNQELKAYFEDVAIWEAFGGNTRDLDSIWEEKGQDCNFTRSGFKNRHIVPGDSVVIPSDAVRTCKGRRQELCDGIRILVDNIQADGAMSDASRLHFFHFTLKEEAKKWLNRIPPSQIRKWEQLESKFLDKFFPPGHTSTVRDMIIRFHQKDKEPIKDAWIRF
ncbi:retrovirus-related pol polyprotein from transposon TNT 1-94, partial [Tanacetum coccineum]